MQTNLVNGLIPPFTECPFRGNCELSYNCTHHGSDQYVAFSCGAARALDLCIPKESQNAD